MAWRLLLVLPARLVLLVPLDLMAQLAQLAQLALLVPLVLPEPEAQLVRLEPL